MSARLPSIFSRLWHQVREIPDVKVNLLRAGELGRLCQWLHVLASGRDRRGWRLGTTVRRWLLPSVWTTLWRQHLLHAHIYCFATAMENSPPPALI